MRGMHGFVWDSRNKSWTLDVLDHDGHWVTVYHNDDKKKCKECAGMKIFQQSSEEAKKRLRFRLYDSRGRCIEEGSLDIEDLSRTKLRWVPGDKRLRNGDRCVDAQSGESLHSQQTMKEFLECSALPKRRGFGKGYGLYPQGQTFQERNFEDLGEKSAVIVCRHAVPLECWCVKESRICEVQCGAPRRQLL
jgi:hypothetical protein